MTQPKIFISYSWTTPEHEKWVLELANRIISDGVDVKLDKWDLKEGHDKYHYMETMVRDKDLTKVLIICDRAYAEKANEKKGGVGTESLIISKEIYDSVTQEKFIPIIAEKDETGNPFVPIFIHSRKYIDLSEVQKFEHEYEKLLRNIFDKPALLKPPIGQPPIYILTEPSTTLKTAHKVQQLRAAIEMDRSYQYDLAEQYCQIFTESLEDFRIDFGKKNFDKLSEFDASIASYNHYLHDYMQFLKESLRFRDEGRLVEILHGFLESNLRYQDRPATISSWSDDWFDNFKYINYELFLITINFYFSAKRYTTVLILMREIYFANNSYKGSLVANSYVAFNEYNKTLEVTRKQKTQSRLYSETADYFIKRMEQNRFNTIDSFIEVDMILFLRSYLHEEKTFDVWYPRTLVYSSNHRNYYLFPRLVRRKYFNIMANLLDVQSKEELIKIYNSKLDENQRNQFFQSGSLRNISLNSFFSFETMATLD